MLNVQLAQRYLELGIAVIPIVSGTKKPIVLWKPYQKRLPTHDEVLSWPWPHDAGIAAVLGPVSNLFAVDVDGPEAHETLVEKVGEIPTAPMSLSGSRSPQRYHLYFRHPQVPTGAKYTPWHDHLEFRGKKGLIVLPLSLHPSGNRYAWAAGRSLAEVPLPDVPPRVLEALEANAERKRIRPTAASNKRPPALRAVPRDIGICRETKRFLRGDYADAHHWNERLFRAACDLAGCDVPMAEAMAMLLAGAQPWNADETEKARRTIESAYGERRVSARELASCKANDEVVATWSSGGLSIREIKHPRRRHLPSSATYRM